MSRTVFTLFDDNRRIYQSDLPEAGASDMLAFSGLLLNPISVEDVRAARTLWISVGTRDGEVTVTLTYTVEGVQTYTVSPGRPLVIETISAAQDVLQSVVISPIGTAPTVEILVYPGIEEEPPLVPLDALLVLNAASGVVVGEEGVSSWIDVRPASGAPAEFGNVGFPPSFVPSHPLLNDQPCILFFSGDRRMGYEGAESTFDFLGSGPFTIAMVAFAADDGIDMQFVSNEDPNEGGGFGMGIDGGNRTFHRLSDDLGASINEGTFEKELVSRAGEDFGAAVAYIIRYDGTNLRVYRQGAEVTTVDTGVSATSVLRRLYLGGNFRNDARMRGGIADLRIWDRELTEDERIGYTEFALQQYGVLDVEINDAPREAIFMLRANRGIVNINDEVRFWADTRPEGLSDRMAVTPEGDDPPLFLAQDEVFGGREAIEFTDFTKLAYEGLALDFAFLNGIASNFTIVLVLVNDAETTAGRSLAGTGRIDGGAPAGPLIRMSQDMVFAEMFGDSTTPIGVITENGVMNDGLAHVIFYSVKTGIPSTANELGIRGNGPDRVTQANLLEVPDGVIEQPFHISERGGSNLGPRFRLAELRVYDRFLSGDNQWPAYVEERYGIPP